MDIYSDQLKQIMSLIVKNTPQEELDLEIKQLKGKIAESIIELQRTLNLLDGITDKYIIHHNTQQVVSLKPSTFISDNLKEHIVEIATRLAKDGVINTQDIIPELRSLGDQKPDKTQLIRIGNILNKRGWRKIGMGKYVKSGIQPKMEVK